MLECDVVGFHTFNYARHFLQARIFYRRFPFIV
jgi:trehalose-6-phosphate synthase